MSWIKTLLYGVRYIFSAGRIMPERPAINFVGATVTDDPETNRTNVEVPGTALLNTATASATPNTIAKRNGL